jgi:hypothetical protein
MKKQLESALGKNQGMNIVLDLSYGLTVYNITCANFFTSYKLGQMSLQLEV